MTDKLFTKRLRELTDDAVRESLAEISVEFEKRFGPAALTASPPVVEREAINRVARALSDESDNGLASQRFERGDNLGGYQALARAAILALTPVEGVGERALRDAVVDLLAIVKGDLSGPAQVSGVISEAEAALAALSTPVAQGDEVRDALERIDKFVTDYLSPWGSWKTPWWEGEVSDDIEFTDVNALKHVAGLVRATLTKGARDAG